MSYVTYLGGFGKEERSGTNFAGLLRYLIVGLAKNNKELSVSTWRGEGDRREGFGFNNHAVGRKRGGAIKYSACPRIGLDQDGGGKGEGDENRGGEQRKRRGQRRSSCSEDVFRTMTLVSSSLSLS